MVRPLRLHDVARAAKESGYSQDDRRALLSEPVKTLREDLDREIGSRITDSAISEFLGALDAVPHSTVRIQMIADELAHAARFRTKRERELTEGERRTVGVVTKLIENAFYRGALANLHGESAAAMAFFLNRLIKFQESMNTTEVVPGMQITRLEQTIEAIQSYATSVVDAVANEFEGTYGTEEGDLHRRLESTGESAEMRRLDVEIQRERREVKDIYEQHRVARQLLDLVMRAQEDLPLVRMHVKEKTTFDIYKRFLGSLEATAHDSLTKSKRGFAIPIPIKKWEEHQLDPKEFSYYALRFESKPNRKGESVARAWVKTLREVIEEVREASSHGPDAAPMVDVVRRMEGVVTGQGLSDFFGLRAHELTVRRMEIQRNAEKGRAEKMGDQQALAKERQRITSRLDEIQQAREGLVRLRRLVNFSSEKTIDTLKLNELGVKPLYFMKAFIVAADFSHAEHERGRAFEPLALFDGSHTLSYSFQNHTFRAKDVEVGTWKDIHVSRDAFTIAQFAVEYFHAVEQRQT